MPKLHLKRTPEEEAARQARKAHRAARRAAKRKRSATVDSASSASGSEVHKRPRAPAEDPIYVYDSDEPGPPPPEAGKPDYDAIRAELEERRFREKLSGAFEDDERLDALEARFNDFAHVPGRWRSGGSTRYTNDEPDGEGAAHSKMDPRYMDDEEYAEWIRVGMYRKTHAEENAERLRQKTLKAERRAKEKALKEETVRLERAAEEERKLRKAEKEHRRREYAREAYERLWKTLLDPAADTTDVAPLKFSDIPWPLLSAYSKSGTTVTIALTDITVDAITEFLLPPRRRIENSDEDKQRKERRDKLRDTMLRFHPDKFEGRIMGRVREQDKAQVREAVGVIARALNALMGKT